jgi:hypothetical protein
MSEQTFRTVVAAVLVGALVLAIVVVIAILPRPATPEPSPAPSTGQATTSAPTSSSAPTSTSAPTPSPAPSAPVPWAEASLTGVGEVQLGTDSASAFVFKLTEVGVDAIPDAPGSFRLTLTDAAGNPSVTYVGTPTIDAPGSLGITTQLTAPNVLMVSIVASDVLNVEPITIGGLTIRAAPTSALGPVSLQLSEFDGSLAGGTTGGDLPPVGTVVAGG